MKTNLRITFLLFLLIVGISDIIGQPTKKERKEQREKEVKEQIVSENYKINVSTAYPRRGKSVHLTSPYSLEIRNDSVFSYLPFYGRAYNIPYGGGDGLIFKAPIHEYKMEMNKRGAAKVEFVTRNNEDRFQFSLNIYSNGSTSINVYMQNRESISFSGEVD